MSMFNLIARAEIVARLAHRGQVDKSGVDYAEHLQYVAVGAFETAPLELRAEAKIVGWLHDIIEDTPLAHYDLQNLGFPKVIVEAVILLSHDPARIPHDDYLREIRDAPGRAGEIARIVKLVDLKHNADPRRAIVGREDWAAKRYGHGLDIMLGLKP